MDAVSSGRYLTRKQVCQRYGGMSEMSPHRWLNGWTDGNGKFHPPIDGFPKPVHIGPHPIWKLRELRDYEAARANAA
jgi:hypothetical protein